MWERKTHYLVKELVFLTRIEKSSFDVHRCNDSGDIIIEADKKSLRDNNIVPQDNVLSNYLTIFRIMR